MRTVRDLAEVHGVAAVYVSHDLAVVAGLAARVGVMYAGRLVEIGAAQQVFKAPAHPYTRRLIEAAPDPKQRRHIVGIPGHVAPLGRRGPGCFFADRCAFIEDACRTQSIDEEPVPGDVSHDVRCRRQDVVRALGGVSVVADDRVAVAVDDGVAPVLELTQLRASYGNVQVAHDASFSLPRGHCLALVGESGSGKTTLSRCVGGLHMEAEGELRLDGKPIAWGPAPAVPYSGK